MKLTFLGTGTSVGIPAIGCHCAVCLSDDPRNKRRRTSLRVEAGGLSLLVDTPPDFREQAITFGVPRIDAVLFTHAHADHIFGFDDIRRYNAMQGAAIPAYGSPHTIQCLRRVFNYIDGEHDPGVYRPQIHYMATDEKFEIGPVQVAAIPVTHGAQHTQGYLFRFGGCSAGYVPDCHHMAPEVIENLRGIDVMILDGLRHKPHTTHLTVAQSVEILEQIGARQSFLTHMCHDLDHAATERDLPANIRLAYDGLTLEW